MTDADVFEDPNIDQSAVAFDDDSPYPEVRSAVSNTDDPSIPVNTFRAWVIGLIWAIILPGINQFFFFRFPAVTVSSVCSFVLLICAYSIKFICFFHIACCATPFVPSRTSVGGALAQCDHLWCLSEPWTLYCQGACYSYHNGGCWCAKCLCRMFRLFFPWPQLEFILIICFM